MPFLDQFWTYTGFTLTVLVLAGYLLGENNFLFRLATYAFIGVASGFVMVAVIYQVLAPRLLWELLAGQPQARLQAGAALVLAVLLLGRLLPRTARLGNLPMGLLVGVGSAVMVAGAARGTLVPQVGAVIQRFFLARPALTRGTTDSFLVEAVFILLGTVSTLVYFQYGAPTRQGAEPRRAAWVEAVAAVGQIFIGITLGALFAGVYAAALTALVERLNFLWSVLSGWMF